MNDVEYTIETSVTMKALKTTIPKSIMDKESQQKINHFIEKTSFVIADDILATISKESSELDLVRIYNGDSD